MYKFSEVLCIWTNKNEIFIPDRRSCLTFDIDFLEKKVIICLNNVSNDSIRIDKIIFQKYYHKHKRWCCHQTLGKICFFFDRNSEVVCFSDWNSVHGVKKWKKRPPLHVFQSEFQSEKQMVSKFFKISVQNFNLKTKQSFSTLGMCKRGQIREANSLNNVNIRVEECRYHVLNSLRSSALVIKIPLKNEKEKNPERLLSVVGTAMMRW